MKIDLVGLNYVALHNGLTIDNGLVYTLTLYPWGNWHF